MLKNSREIDDVEIVLGILIDLKSFQDNFLQYIKENLEINTSFDEFKDDFENGMYGDELHDWFTECTSDFNTYFDELNDDIIFCINLNDENIENMSIKDLKLQLASNLQKFNIFVDIDDIDIFALEDD